ncbi:MAG TPA: hypothetical protein VF712_11255 [Thermoleophilaceae bacterium]
MAQDSHEPRPGEDRPAAASPRAVARFDGAVRRDLGVALGLALALIAAVVGVTAGESHGEAHVSDALQERTDAARREERERAEQRRSERGTPEARQRRAESRDAFAGIGRSEAAAVARDHFAGFFADALWPQPQAGDGAHLGRFVNDFARVVERPGETDRLMVSPTPLRVEDASGEKRPVDPDLVERAGALEPAHGPGSARIGTDAREGVRLANGVAIRAAGTEEPSAAVVRGDKAFFADVGDGADTDLAVAPLPNGAELAFQLRSAESPEDPALHFDLPAGALLRISKGGPADEVPEGGAQVLRGSKVLAGVLRPTAVDADGEPVDAKYEARGDDLVIRVPHRDKDLRYPILVDPYAYVIEGFLGSSFVNDANPTYRWDWQKSGADHFDTPANAFGIGIGMFDSSAHPPYPAGSWGEWWWQAPANTQIVRADFQALYYTPYFSCAQAFLAADRWGNNIQGPLHQTCNDDWWVNSPTGRDRTVCTHPSGSCAAPGNSTYGNVAIYRLFSTDGNGRWLPASASMGQATMHLWEGHRPTWGAVSGENTSGWFDPGSGGHTFSATSSDVGLGIWKASFKRPSRTSGTGSVINETPPANCTGQRGSLCQPSVGWTWGYAYDDLPEGNNTLGLYSVDIIGNHSAGDQNNLVWDKTWQVKVDRAAPAIGDGTAPLPQRRWVNDSDARTAPVLSDTASGIKGAQLLTRPGQFAWDSFGRAITGGWGSAERSGTWGAGAWTLDNTAALYSVANGRGEMTASPSSSTSAYLGSWTGRDVDARVAIKFPDVAPLSGSQTGALTLRRSGTAAYRIGLDRDSQNKLRVVGTNGSGAAIGIPVQDTGYIYAAGESYNLRAQVLGATSGTARTNIRVRVWKAGTAEPKAWTTTGVDDASAGPQTGGWVGLRTSAGVSAATVGYDDFTAVDQATYTLAADLQQSCSAASGCGTPWTPTLNWSSTQYPEGSYGFRVRSWDPVHGQSGAAYTHETTKEWVRGLDRTSPESLDATGSFAADGSAVGADAHTINVTARDQFSGIRRLEFWVDGALHSSKDLACSPECNTTETWPVTWDTVDIENKPYSMKLVALDGAGNPARERTWTVRRDDTDPLTQVEGSLWDAHEQVLSEGSYGLSLTAYDGDANGTEAGLASVEIRVNGQSVYSNASTCTGATCTLSVPWTFNTSTYGTGSYTIEIRVTDRAGNTDVNTVETDVKLAPPQPVDDIDLAGRPGLPVHGAAAGDQAGRSVVQLGDVNGDDLDDYAIGAPGADRRGRLDSGSVYVVYGNASATSIDLKAIDDSTAAAPAEGFRIDGAAAGDFTGYSVANVGDVNGDGNADLAIGAPRTGLLGGTLSAQGLVHVVYGGLGSGHIDLSLLGDPGGHDGFTILGPIVDLVASPALPGQPATTFGVRLAGHRSGDYAATGDFSGDGREDVVIGSSGDDPASRVDAGSTYVVFGKTGNADVSVASLGSQGLRIDGAATGHRSGFAAAIPGDIDGDGLDDAVLTAPGANATGRLQAGTAYVVLGAPGGGTLDLAAGPTRAYAISGDTGDELGSSVASLGDVDWDQRDEFAIGGHDSYVMYGRSGTSPVDLASPASYFGYKVNAPGVGDEWDSAFVTGAGDVNEDNVGDVLIGYPRGTTGRADQGATYALFGGTSTRPDVDLAGIQGHRAARVLGVAASDGSGTSATGLDAARTDESGVVTGSPNASPNPDGTPRPGAGQANTTHSSSFKGDDPEARTEVQGAAVAFCSNSRTRGGGYNKRGTPYCFRRGTDHPYWRRTDKKKQDIGLRGVPGAGNPRLPIHALTNTDGDRVTLVDSFAQPIAQIRQNTTAEQAAGTCPKPSRGKRPAYRSFTLFDVGATQGRRVQGCGVRLDFVGFGCMRKKTWSSSYVLVGVIGGKVRDHDAIRAFVPRAALPTNGAFANGKIGRYQNGCGKRNLFGGPKKEQSLGIANQTVAYHDFADRISTDALTDGREDHLKPLEMYQSRNATGGSNSDDGSFLSNYFEPRVSFAPQYGNSVRRKDVAFVTNATTGVSKGGGHVRAVVRTDQYSGGGTQYRPLDEILYTDTNVPCNVKNPSLPRHFVAHWVYGNFNPNPPPPDDPSTTNVNENTDESPIYGWYVTRRPYTQDPKFRDERFGCDPD